VAKVASTGTRAGCTRRVEGVPGHARHGERLDDEAEPPREGDVHGREAVDALGGDLVGRHALPEGQRREDGDLVARVAAAHVERGVGLGVARGLRLGEGHVEREPLLGHAREDVVAGAVHDAADGQDALRRERLAQHADDGDAAGHGRLVVEVHALLFGEVPDLGAALGEQRLVGGDHVLAGQDGGAHHLVGALDAAHDLDDDLDLGVVHELHRVRGELLPRHQLAAHGGDVAHGDAAHVERHAEAALDGRGVLFQQLEEPRPHNATTHEPDTDRLGHLGRP
jgi:hypothetical protein